MTDPRSPDARAAALAALDAAAAAGQPWAIRLLCTGQDSALRAEAQTPPGAEPTNDGPRWSGWTVCPHCHEAVAATLGASPVGLVAWLYTSRECSPEQLATAPDWLRRLRDPDYRDPARPATATAATPPTATAPDAPSTAPSRRYGR